MEQETAPNFSGDYPMAGERIGPAWQRVWDRMADRKWLMTQVIARDPELRGDLQPKTMENLIRRAFRAGLLERRYAGSPRMAFYRRKP